MKMPSLTVPTTDNFQSKTKMKMMTTVLSALLLAGAFAGYPTQAFSQDDHAGHVHDEHGHEAGTPKARSTEARALHEGHDEHEGHDHGEEEEEHSDEVTLSPEAIRLYNIRTEKAERRTLIGATTVPARVSYNTEAMAHIGTQVQGRVQEIAVRLGDHVERGQLLLVIDSPALGTAQSDFLQQDAAVDAAAVNVEAAEAMLEVAQTAFERAETLRASNGISTTEYLQRQGALREAEANVRRAQAELRVAQSKRLAAENQLHIYGYDHEHCDELLASGEIHTRYEIFAPIAGQVIQREVTPGEIVDPSNEALMVLANMEELWVLGDVPERLIGRVSVGTTARVTIGALPEMAFEGTVSYIAPQLDFRTRTASVRIVIPSAAPASHGTDREEEDHAGHDHGEAHVDNEATEEHTDEDAEAEAHMAGQFLKPGMFGEAELVLAPRPGESGLKVIVVPFQSVLTVEGSPAVFVPVAGKANTFAKRTVTLGERVGNIYPVLSGLAEGEEYVATNPFILKADLGKAGAKHVH